MNILQHALAYADLGFSVIPIRAKEKKAGWDWEIRQHEHMPRNHFNGWWSGLGSKPVNLGIVTGKISGVWALDIDAKDASNEILHLVHAYRVPVQQTWSGGYHLLFRLPEQGEIRNRVGILPGVDVRGEGGYIVAAPSYVFDPGTNQGGNYRWLKSPMEVEPPPAPRWLLELVLNGTIAGYTQPPKVTAPPAPTVAPIYDPPIDIAFEDFSLNWAQEQLGKAIASARGQGARNDALNRITYRMGLLATHNWLTEGEIETAMMNSSLGASLTATDGQNTVIRTIKSALEGAKKAKAKSAQDEVYTQCRKAFTAFKKGVTTAPDRRRDEYQDAPAPYHLANADKLVNLKYISDFDLPTSGAYMVRSPIGTGKTELMKRITAWFKEQQTQGANVNHMVAFTHRVSLTANVAERLNFDSYQGLNAKYQRMTGSLAMTINSIPNLVENGKMKTFDVVIIDEIEQQLAHIIGGTMKANGHYVLELLTYVIRNAKLVVCLDAHIGELSHRWLKAIRPDVKLVVNQYQHTPKPLTLLGGDTEAIAKADELIEENAGVVLMPCESRAYAKKLYERFSWRLKPDELRLIDSDNSMTADTQAFLKNINAELPKLKLLIYSPSMGTGVDITCAVRAVVGIFNGNSIVASDMLQMLGRARKAQEYIAYVPPKKTEHLPPTAEKEYKRRLTAERKNLASVVVNPDGQIDISDSQKRLLALFSHVEHQRKTSRHDLLKDFRRLADEEYFITVTKGHVDEVIKGEMKLAGTEVKRKWKELVLSVPALDPDAHQDKNGRGEITEEDNAGLHRWHIENLYKAELTEPIFDHHARIGTRRFLAFCDLYAPPELAKEHDRKQHKEDVPVHFRTHSYSNREIIWHAIRAVWGDVDNLTQLHDHDISLEDIENGMSEFMEKHGETVRAFTGRRVSHSDKPLDLLRWLLARAGLKLQLIRNQAKAGRYRLQKRGLEEMSAYAIGRLEAIEESNSDALRDSAYIEDIELALV